MKEGGSFPSLIVAMGTPRRPDGSLFKYCSAENQKENAFIEKKYLMSLLIFFNISVCLTNIERSSFLRLIGITSDPNINLAGAKPKGFMHIAAIYFLKRSR